MLNRSSEMIFNPSHFISVVDVLRRNEDVIEIIVNNLMYSSKSEYQIRKVYGSNS